MGKIRKNLSDNEMLANWQEETSFENLLDGRSEPNRPRPVKGTEEKGWQSFFTDSLKEEIGKAMLQLKVNLYKEGIVDFKLQPEVQGRQIILTAVPKKTKKK